MYLKKSCGQCVNNLNSFIFCNHKYTTKRTQLNVKMCMSRC